MAFGVRVLSGVKRRITQALRFLRIIQPTAKYPDPVVNLQPFLNKGVMALQGLEEEMANQFADDLRGIISRQLISWVPLSSGYAIRKRTLGLDPRILIATGRYVNSIQAMQQKDGTWLVSVPDEPLRPGSKHTLKDLARWLEYGTLRMPARPHWRPAQNIWRTKIYQMKRRLHFDLVQELKRAGYR